MKKLKAIVLAVMLFGLIASPVTAATFTQITQPDATYLAGTTKIDISGLTNFTDYGSITDGTLTVNFSTPMNKRGPVPTGWATWSSPPWSESATPHIFYSNGQTSIDMTLSQRCTTFGFELESNPFINKDYDIDFILMSGPAVIGTISMTVNGNAGARLFAASVTSGSFDQIVINGETDFAIAQIRYICGVSVDIDITPGTDRNSINAKSKGVIPVAILSHPGFDPATVDVTTLRFGPNAATLAYDLTDPVTYAGHISLDLNGDGINDLVSHYRTQATGLLWG